MIFTPRISSRSEERLEMDISEADNSQTQRGVPWEGEFTDQRTGKRYVIRAAACGLRCMCDAVIVRELPPVQLVVH